MKSCGAWPAVDVELLDAVPRSEIPALLGSADVLVEQHPDRHRRQGRLRGLRVLCPRVRLRCVVCLAPAGAASLRAGGRRGSGGRASKRSQRAIGPIGGSWGVISAGRSSAATPSSPGPTACSRRHDDDPPRPEGLRHLGLRGPSALAAAAPACARLGRPHARPARGRAGRRGLRRRDGCEECARRRSCAFAPISTRSRSCGSSPT